CTRRAAPVNHLVLKISQFVVFRRRGAYNSSEPFSPSQGVPAMLRRFLPALAALTCLALATARAADADDLVPNPRYKGWADFKPGATVTHKEKTRFPAGSPQNKYYPEGVDERDVTYKLVSVSPDKVVVETVVLDYELLSQIETAPTRITYPAKVKRAYVEGAREQLKVKEGKEDIEVQGKTYKCEWYETTRTTSDGEVMTRKRWIAAEVPGGIVKEVTVTKKGDQVVDETTTTVTEMKAGK